MLALSTDNFRLVTRARLPEVPPAAPVSPGQRLARLLPVLGLVLIVGVLASLAIGVVSVSPRQVAAIVADHLGADTGVDYSRAQDAVVWSIRLPRVAVAILVGAALGMAGAALQGMFRNPLADPQLVGVSSGAALGAVIAIIVAGAGLGSFVTPVGGALGALVGGIVVYASARYQGRTEVVTLVLAGIAVGAIAIAAVGFLTVAVDDESLPSLAFWSLGSLTPATWEVFRAALPFVAVPLLVLPFYARPLNLALLGEAEARHLGVDMDRLLAAVLGLTALAVGASVASAGVIGFVGLLAPHAVRMVAGPDHRVVLPAAAFGGATLVVWADLVARNIARPSEVPVGLLTALVGGPFFLWLLRRTRREHGGWG